MASTSRYGRPARALGGARAEEGPRGRRREGLLHASLSAAQEGKRPRCPCCHPGRNGWPSPPPLAGPGVLRLGAALAVRGAAGPSPVSWLAGPSSVRLPGWQEARAGRGGPGLLGLLRVGRAGRPSAGSAGAGGRRARSPQLAALLLRVVINR